MQVMTSFTLVLLFIALGASLRLDTSNVPPRAIVGQSYAGKLEASSGIEPYRFSFTGALPEGLNLDSDTGDIFGVPLTAGDFALEFTVHDAREPNPSSDSRSFSFQVADPLGLDVSGVPLVAIYDVDYLGNLLGTGGFPPYHYSIVSGELPLGLSLDGNTAVITGKPQQSTPPNDFYSVVFQVTDDEGQSFQSDELTIEVQLPLTISTANLPKSTAVGAAYDGFLSAVGGREPYTFFILDGAVPDGLIFESSGRVSGSPVAQGSFTVVFEVKDDALVSDNTTFTFEVEADGSLVLSTANLSIYADIGIPYLGNLTASGGVGPYFYAVTNGTLPPGLVLNRDTGVISGTPIIPTSPITYPFIYLIRFNVTDSALPTPTRKSEDFAFAVGGPMSLDSSVIPQTAQVGSNYTGVLVVTGGLGPYETNLTNCAPGLALDEIFLLVGIPTTAGVFSCNFTMTDRLGLQTSLVVRVVVSNGQATTTTTTTTTTPTTATSTTTPTPPTTSASTTTTPATTSTSTTTPTDGTSTTTKSDPTTTTRTTAATSAPATSPPPGSVATYNCSQTGCVVTKSGTLSGAFFVPLTVTDGLSITVIDFIIVPLLTITNGGGVFVYGTANIKTLEVNSGGLVRVDPSGSMNVTFDALIGNGQLDIFGGSFITFGNLVVVSSKVTLGESALLKSVVLAFSGSTALVQNATVFCISAVFTGGVTNMTAGSFVQATRDINALSGAVIWFEQQSFATSESMVFDSTVTLIPVYGLQGAAYALRSKTINFGGATITCFVTTNLLGNPAYTSDGTAVARVLSSRQVSLPPATFAPNFTAAQQSNCIQTLSLPLAQFSSQNGIVSSTTTATLAYPSASCDQLAAAPQPAIAQTSASVLITVSRDTNRNNCPCTVQSSGGLSTGAIIGIAVGVTGGVIVLFVFVLIIARRKELSHLNSMMRKELQERDKRDTIAMSSTQIKQ